MEPSWISSTMPQDQATMNDLLSVEFKAMIADKKYGVPTEPLYGVYTATVKKFAPTFVNSLAISSLYSLALYYCLTIYSF